MLNESMNRFAVLIWSSKRSVDSEIFANSIKRHISDAKNSPLRQDLPVPINDRVILLLCEGFILTKLVRSFAKIKSS